MPLINTQKINQHKIIGLWQITEDEKLFSQMLVLDDEHQYHLSKIKHPHKRLEWLSSRLMIKMMTKYLQLEYDGINKDENGKPLLNRSSTQISITHSYPYVGIIMDKYYPVGIDIEQIKDKIILLAPRFLSKKELSFANNDKTILTLFWSAKEVLYKLHSKKKVVFANNFLINSFNLNNKGEFDAAIIINGSRKEVKLSYQVKNNFVITYNTN